MVRGIDITDEQQEAVRAVIQWIQIRAQWDDGLDADWVATLLIDADHSSLLTRLLYGIKPQDVPPPLAHSYPWYDLGEVGSAHDLEVSFMRVGGLDLVSIFQFPWRILEKVSDDFCLVTYRDLCPTYALQRQTDKPNRWSLKRLDIALKDLVADAIQEADE